MEAEQNFLSRLLYYIHTELELTAGQLSEVMGMPENEVHDYLDKGWSLALWDLHRQQTVKLCGTRIKA